MTKKLLLALTVAGCVFAAIGCGSSTPATTAEQKKDFAGGPMPEDARKQFEESQKASAGKIAGKMQENGQPPIPVTPGK